MIDNSLVDPAVQSLAKAIMNKTGDHSEDNSTSKNPQEEVLDTLEDLIVSKLTGISSADEEIKEFIGLGNDNLDDDWWGSYDYGGDWDFGSWYDDDDEEGNNGTTTEGRDETTVTGTTVTGGTNSSFAGEGTGIQGVHEVSLHFRDFTHWRLLASAEKLLKKIENFLRIKISRQLLIFPTFGSCKPTL